MEFSNQNYFKKYLLVRNSILILVLCSIIGIVLKIGSDIFELLSSVAIFGVLILLFFESTSAPNYVKICHYNDKTWIELFIPDTRFLILFRQSKLMKREISQNAKLSHSISSGKTILTKSIRILFEETNEKYKIGDFDVLSASNKNFNNLEEIIKTHNAKITVTNY